MASLEFLKFLPPELGTAVVLLILLGGSIAAAFAFTKKQVDGAIEDFMVRLKKLEERVEHLERNQKDAILQLDSALEVMDESKERSKSHIKEAKRLLL